LNNLNKRKRRKTQSFGKARAMSGQTEKKGEGFNKAKKILNNLNRGAVSLDFLFSIN